LKGILWLGTITVALNAQKSLKQMRNVVKNAVNAFAQNALKIIAH
jgi:hypothetical protein